MSGKRSAGTEVAAKRIIARKPKDQLDAPLFSPRARIIISLYQPRQSLPKPKAQSSPFIMEASLTLFTTYPFSPLPLSVYLSS